tara:strand:- start:751 stop:993 length:243 start_codon:yes stop_codon:yes gene_type:complete
MGRETKKKRKFKSVPKTKRGVPKKYVKGASNPMVRESEIIETKKLYVAGQLTAEDYDRISKERSEDGRKKKKRKTKSKNA